MSSYYKEINGVKYDKAMLEAADKSIEGKGDGRISLEDSKYRWRIQRCLLKK